MIRIRELTLRPGEDVAKLKKRAADYLSLPQTDILEMKLVKRSVDARKKQDIRISYTVDVCVRGKEEKILREWLSWGFDIDGVRMAYEITVNATSKPSLSYTNKILESWHAAGIKTVDAIDRADKKPGGNQGGMSFDVDDFFKAALDRSYNPQKK